MTGELIGQPEQQSFPNAIEIFPPRLYSGDTPLESNAVVGFSRVTPIVALDGVPTDLFLARGQSSQRFHYPYITLEPNLRYACAGGSLYSPLEWQLDEADLKMLTINDADLLHYIDSILNFAIAHNSREYNKVMERLLVEGCEDVNFSTYNYLQILAHHLSKVSIRPDVFLSAKDITNSIDYPIEFPTPENVLDLIQSRITSKTRRLARIADWTDLITSGLHADVIERCTAHYATTGYETRIEDTAQAVKQLYSRLVERKIPPKRAFDTAMKLAAYAPPDFEQCDTLLPRTHVNYLDDLVDIFISQAQTHQLSADTEVSVIKNIRGRYPLKSDATIKDPALVDACVEAATVRNLGIAGTSTHIFNKVVTAMTIARDSQDAEIAKQARDYVRASISGDPIHFMTYLFKRLGEMTCTLEDATPEGVPALTEQMIREIMILRSCNIRASQESYNISDQINIPITDTVLSSMLDQVFRYRYPRLYEQFTQVRSNMHGASEEGRLNYYISKLNILTLLLKLTINQPEAQLRRGRFGIIDHSPETITSIPLSPDVIQLDDLDLHPSEKSTSKLMRHMTEKTTLSEQINNLDTLEAAFENQREDISEKIVQTVMNRHDNLRTRIVVKDEKLAEFIGNFANSSQGVNLTACYIRSMHAEQNRNTTESSMAIQKERIDCKLEKATSLVTPGNRLEIKGIGYRAIHLHFDFTIANLPQPVKVEFQIFPESRREGNHRFESLYGTDILDPNFDGSDLPMVNENPWFN